MNEMQRKMISDDLVNLAIATQHNRHFHVAYTLRLHAPS